LLRRSNPAARRKARYQQRQRAGRMCVMLELDGPLIDWLVSVQWLEPAKADDRVEIGDAIRRMLTDAMRSDRS
jgi:hypothetical protein